MFTIFATAFNGVVPILLLVLLGYFLRQRNFLTKEFLAIGNKLVFRVLLPCMLFVNIYRIGSLGDIRLDVPLYCVGIAVVIFLVGIGIAMATTPVPQRRGVLLQGFFRSNFAIIGLPLAEAVGGVNGAASAAVVSAFAIPSFNILAVIALTVFLPPKEGKSGGIKQILRSVAKNPLIIAVFLGLFTLLLREVQNQIWGETVFSISRNMPFFYTCLDNLRGATTPIALLILGGQFEFSAVSTLKKEILVGTLGRLLLAPTLGIGVAIVLSGLGWMPLGPGEYACMVALFGSPVAVSSAVMTREMGSDEQLSVQLIVWTSIVSVVTIFALVCILMAFGFITI